MLRTTLSAAALLVLGASLAAPATARAQQAPADTTAAGATSSTDTAAADSAKTAAACAILDSAFQRAVAKGANPRSNPQALQQELQVVLARALAAVPPSQRKSSGGKSTVQITCNSAAGVRAGAAAPATPDSAGAKPAEAKDSTSE